MKVSECWQNLPYNYDSLFLGENSFVYYMFKQLASIAIFHYYVIMFLVSISLIELDDIWVVNLHQNLQLLLKHLKIIINFFPGNTFNSEQFMRIAQRCRLSHASEVTTSNQLSQTVHLSYVLFHNTLHQGHWFGKWYLSIKWFWKVTLTIQTHCWTALVSVVRLVRGLIFIEGVVVVW